mmetsp:Transcript_77868/g.225185  ORF Transcript_77868/g.225185 Transcript_77868/m.225185 type:complete len:200 (-) Transcript_77868:345-944(-)
MRFGLYAHGRVSEGSHVAGSAVASGLPGCGAGFAVGRGREARRAWPPFCRRRQVPLSSRRWVAGLEGLRVAGTRGGAGGHEEFPRGRGRQRSCHIGDRAARRRDLLLPAPAWDGICGIHSSRRGSRLRALPLPVRRQSGRGPGRGAVASADATPAVTLPAFAEVVAAAGRPRRRQHPSLRGRLVPRRFHRRRRACPFWR